MRTIDEERFNEWYKAPQALMAADPLMRWFTDTRNAILKEGPERPGVRVEIRGVYALGDGPPGTVSWFFGDRRGGTGWRVRREDGSIETVYANMSGDNITTRHYLPTPPSHHLGEPIHDQSLENLARRYLAFLERLVADAADEFLSSG